jgi:PPOX class probable F420-dependent enzyme
MTSDTGVDVHGRALDRLRTDLIAWLTTVTDDGQPQSMPIWFLWTDEGEILVYSQDGARRNRNLAANPKVAFHFSDDGGGGDIVSIDGVARIDPGYPQGEHNPAYLAKYQGLLDGSKWTPAYFSSRYNVPILIHPTRVRIG